MDNFFQIPMENDMESYNKWLTCKIEEILPSKFLTKCMEMVKEGWELTDIQSDHQSGFTMHRATFMKYDNE
jgi:hypothetical protein